MDTVADHEAPGAWPAHGREVRPWRQTVRGGTKDDRMLREIRVWLPPHIADRDLIVQPKLASQIEECLREIAALDAGHGAQLGALGTLLLRTESVASSKIEQVESNQSATSMAAATRALQELIDSVGGGDLTTDAVLRSHHALMHRDPGEATYAGRTRDMQNWIGGSDYSPRNALYVPAPPETVKGYVDDLIAFTNRDDLSAMVQAAIVHAQFESIHPFTDGNGRIGRALFNTVLRRRGVTTTVVVPLAAALVARREAYFEVLNRYRDGDPEPISAPVARASTLAAQESRVTAVRMAELPQDGAMRSGEFAGTAQPRG